jgi:quercetin 2,3-dioxygenase
MEKYILNGRHTMDGAGVKLVRLLDNNTAELSDPFLLLDCFGSDDPKDYLKGFPRHPHRGIETVTYMIEGIVEHADSLGNSGVIKSGEIQWMSAGSGIIHQEMPKKYDGLMRGFQLWVNMPSKYKMTHPKYRGILKNEIPSVKHDGIEAKIISGEYEGKKGPVTDLVVDVQYLDITMDKNKKFGYNLKKGYTTFCCVMDGSGYFEDNEITENQLILFKDISKIDVKSKTKLRFILVSGKPINEPIAWGGPIVMNTQAELRQAFKELDEGTFIK